GRSAAFDTEYWAGSWKYVVVTYDGSSTSEGLALYVDGTPAGEHPCLYGCIDESGNYPLPSRGSNDNTPAIGMQPDGSARLHGAVDEVAVYDRALTDEEILEHWNARTVPYCSTHLSVDDGGWHHLGLAADAVRTTLYLDGHQACALSTALASGETFQVGDPIPGSVGCSGTGAEACLFGPSAHARDLA